MKDTSAEQWTPAIANTSHTPAFLWPYLSTGATYFEARFLVISNDATFLGQMMDHVLVENILTDRPSEHGSIQLSHANRRIGSEIFDPRLYSGYRYCRGQRGGMELRGGRSGGHRQGGYSNQQKYTVDVRTEKTGGSRWLPFQNGRGKGSQHLREKKDVGMEEPISVLPIMTSNQLSHHIKSIDILKE